MGKHAAAGEHPSKSDVALQPIVRLAVFQFVLYSIVVGIAAAGWLLAVSGNHVLLISVFGQYLTDHIVRWTAEVPLWGVLCGTAGLLGMTAAWAMCRIRTVGVMIGVASYALGFAVDLAVARTLFVHSAIGLVMGWMLFSPIMFGWRCFRRSEIQYQI